MRKKPAHNKAKRLNPSVNVECVWGTSQTKKLNPDDQQAVRGSCGIQQRDIKNEH
tara:strand:+ start:3453 stop:3617 length:165 start_codon:yes stop_codon:yes gene_type:complete